MRGATFGALAVSATVISGCSGASSAATVTHSPVRAVDASSQHLYKVPSGSMEPTLGPGARVVISSGRPRVGEIVVFHPPKEAELEECGPTRHTITPGGAACVDPVPRPSTVKFIKRVVAGPGDEIYIRDGNVYRKAAGQTGFVRQPDPYTRPCGARPECSFPTPIGVPAGHWYLLGDNRGESDDSRFFGAVPTSWIVGIVTACATHFAPANSIAERIGARDCRPRRTRK